MNKNRKQIEDKKPKKAPLVYINRVEMKELDENNEYEFLPDIIDKDGNVINNNAYTYIFSFQFTFISIFQISSIFALFCFR